MCLTVALFFANVTILVSNQEFSKEYCIYVGFSIHYVWLVVFCCTTNCSLHMYKSFSGMSIIVSTKAKEKTYFLKSLIAITVLPLVFVLCFLVYAYLGSAIIPYQGSACFIKSVWHAIAFFHAPITLLCLLNSTLFIITIAYISKVPKTASNLEKRRYTFIYLKLFVITGTPWVLQFIDGFLSSSVFSYIVSVLNSSQGVMIFLSYVCNKNILSSIKSAFATKSSETSESDRPAFKTYVVKYELGKCSGMNNRKEHVYFELT